MTDGTTNAPLIGLVVAVGDVGLGIVFLNPGDDVLGVERDAVAELDVVRQRLDEQLHGAVE